MVKQSAPVDNKKQIVKLLHSISGRYSLYQVFSDWIEVSAIAIRNACTLIRDDVWEKREKRYFDIIENYTDDERTGFAKMLALLTKEFERELREKCLTDVLGEIYMEMEAGNKHLGQVFTPYSLALLCAKLVIDDNTEIVPFLEPCCGGGSMVIAIAQELLESGKDYRWMMRGICQDLDSNCVHMCYVQLSLLGIDAVIARGDALADPYPETLNAKYTEERLWRTPRNMGMIF